MNGRPYNLCSSSLLWLIEGTPKWRTPLYDSCPQRVAQLATPLLCRPLWQSWVMTICTKNLHNCRYILIMEKWQIGCYNTSVIFNIVIQITMFANSWFIVSPHLIYISPCMWLPSITHQDKRLGASALCTHIRK